LLFIFREISKQLSNKVDLAVDEYNKEIADLLIAKKFRDIFDSFLTIVNENQHKLFNFKISLA
jgi:hypothetical protein